MDSMGVHFCVIPDVTVRQLNWMCEENATNFPPNGTQNHTRTRPQTSVGVYQVSMAAFIIENVDDGFDVCYSQYHVVQDRRNRDKR